MDCLLGTIERLTGVHIKPEFTKLQVWQARCCGIKAVCLADWLYRDASIVLERKAALAQEAMTSTGVTYAWQGLTPKMRETFPHILERYEVAERVGR